MEKLVTELLSIRFIFYWMELVSTIPKLNKTYLVKKERLVNYKTIIITKAASEVLKRLGCCFFSGIIKF